MSIIIAPDSFKGSLSAEEFCRIAAAKENLRRCFDDSKLPYPYI